MHKSSYLRMEYLVRHYDELFHEKAEMLKVLDIGSYDMGGTYKKIFENSRYHYTGLDMVQGPNVDLVPADIYHWKEIEDETFHLVISGQVFEHIEYPWLTMQEIARVLKPSGFCVLIAPNSGMEHGAPKDCYRYYADGLSALAKWVDFKVHHVSVGGVPETEKIIDWMSEWNDGCLVAQKQPWIYPSIKEPFTRERRVPINDSATYQIWKNAVAKACGNFREEKPIVLFGAGWIGDTVLEILGNDKICFFVDNSSIKIGSQRKGKRVISLQEYKKNSERYNCLVTASEHAALEIKEKLRLEGIECQILFGE